MVSQAQEFVEWFEMSHPRIFNEVHCAFQRYMFHQLEDMTLSEEHKGSFFDDSSLSEIIQNLADESRLKFILKEYETTVYVEEAIHRLVEINYKIGLLDESKRYANLLGYNYASSEWYKKSYKILNKDYDDPYKKIKNKSTISKLKSILD